MARRKVGFWQRGAVVLVKPALTVMTRRDWQGMANIPREGPVIIVANHLSHADPLALAHFVYDAGRWPVFLAKSGLFRIPVLGPLLRAVEQTPVERGTVDAVKALDAARLAVKAGKCVLIYPEGTTTREPQLWPMRGKTGAARLWLETGAPVVPVVMWGPQRLFDPRTHKFRPVPRTPVTVVAGPPLDLSKWTGASPTAPVLAEITEHMMLALRDMLAPLRDATPPPLWQPGRRASTSDGRSTEAGDAGPGGVAGV
ncbi:MAG TPA: lysophospholipid acyltransferase family protein [Micromonosporaceae bacterium]